VQYTQVFNPQWSNAAKTAITCEVLFTALGDTRTPFTAVVHEPGHSADIYARCAAGEFGPVAAFVAPPPAPPPNTSALRRAAYVAEADPLFFMSQRGEATQADWLAKVAEIKARWPA
jgi:hypothetical protein